MTTAFTPFSMEAHTKVNLALRVLRKRKDGYHELDTVFQELDWGDTLHFAPAEKFRFQQLGLPYDDGGKNICLTAVELFCETSGLEPKVNLSLDKWVPPGSGLGGGVGGRGCHTERSQPY